MQPVVTPAVATAVVRRQKKIVAAFRDAGAVRPSTAVTPVSVGVSEKRPFRQLCEHAVLREAGAGRFYVDDASWHALRVRRRRFAIAAVVAVVAALLIGWALRESLG